MIFARLVASFPLLFTIFGDVFCSKFSGVWETLWIFKVARWTHDKCTKVNKSPTVNDGVGASSFEIWTANLAQLLTVEIQTGNFAKLVTPKPDIQVDISDLGFYFLNALIFEWKKSKPVGLYKNTVFANWEKYEVSWNLCLVFIIDF